MRRPSDVVCREFESRWPGLMCHRIDGLYLIRLVADQEFSVKCKRARELDRNAALLLRFAASHLHAKSFLGQ